MGSRMNTGLPKQFMPIAGVPMLAYSIRAFHGYDPSIEIIIAIPEGFEDQWKKLAHEIHLDIPYHIVNGGSERFYSVGNVLNAINHHGECVVAIHDAARPFVSIDLIDKAFKNAIHAGSAIPSIHVKDTLRVKLMDEWATADRSMFRAIQTPQVFNLSLLKSAYTQSYNQKFTDDATVFETAGNKIYLIDGEEDNFKITTNADLDYAEYLIQSKKTS